MTRVFFLLLCTVLVLSGCTAAVDVTTPDPVNRAMADLTRSGSVTQEQAQSMALEHAGLTADQVDRLHTEYEVDDHIPRYEVQFDYDGWEYDYEIHAETGEILSYDKDLND